MIRQRVSFRTPAPALVVRVLTAVLGIALIWYGSMVVLLAVKVSPHTVNLISGYRSVYRDAAGLTSGDFTTPRRLVVGFAGLLVFVTFTYLAVQEVPRARLARTDVDLGSGDRGRTVVRPRAVERAAEFAVRSHKRVTRVAGRLGEEQLNVNVHLSSARGVEKSLRDVHSRARRVVERHELPPLAINVTLVGYDRPTRRELG